MNHSPLLALLVPIVTITVTIIILTVAFGNVLPQHLEGFLDLEILSIKNIVKTDFFGQIHTL